MPPTKQDNKGQDIEDEDSYAVGPGRDRDRRGFLEEEASINISCLIENARIEVNIPKQDDARTSAMARLLQPDCCNEKRGY